MGAGARGALTAPAAPARGPRSRRSAEGTEGHRCRTSGAGPAVLAVLGRPAAEVLARAAEARVGTSALDVRLDALPAARPAPVPAAELVVPLVVRDRCSTTCPRGARRPAHPGRRGPPAGRGAGPARGRPRGRGPGGDAAGAAQPLPRRARPGPHPGGGPHAHVRRGVRGHRAGRVRALPRPGRAAARARRRPAVPDARPIDDAGPGTAHPARRRGPSGEAVWLGDDEARERRHPHLPAAHRRSGNRATSAHPLQAGGRVVPVLGACSATRRDLPPDERADTGPSMTSARPPRPGRRTARPVRRRRTNVPSARGIPLRPAGGPSARSGAGGPRARSGGRRPRPRRRGPRRSPTRRGSARGPCRRR